MPLLKRKPFPQVQPPQDLNPDEPVFQVRFTKEIFRDYQEYVNRINLYRQRVWTCNVTGKTNLTYEEALVSERRAAEKVQQFPKELMAPVLRIVQFSTLRLKDLISTIFTRLQGHLLEGEELYGRKDQSVCPCRILKILEDADNTHYEVGWLDKNKKVTGVSTVNALNLIRRKLPFSRNLLKSFIRESTSQSAPWVVHDNLARKHGILTEPPEGLRDKIFTNGCLCSNERRQENKSGRDNISDAENGKFWKKTKKQEIMSSDAPETAGKKAREEEDKPKEEPIKYPIDDLLVKPCPDDPDFTNRPFPTRDFCVPVDSFGDLLTIWDFCSSFSRLLHLWPFSLDDFENAVCHKDSDLILVSESHSAILRLLIKDKGDYFTATKKKRRKSKITLMNWTEYLCDFLEMEDIPELSSHIGTIKRGHYGLLDPHVKLGILGELVSQALSTDAIREQLDEYIGQRRELGARKREKALEEATKRRTEQQHLKETKSETEEVMHGHDLENGGGNSYSNGDVSAYGNENFSYNGNKGSANGRSNHTVTTSRNEILNQRMDARVSMENAKESSSLTDHRKAKRKRKDKESETQEKNTKEQRKEHFEREIEKQYICTNPLGKDRNYNRYWFFQRDGRIFIESSDCKQWGCYTTKEELDAFIGSLNPKGEREMALQKQLEKHYSRISSALQKRSKDISQRIALEQAVLRRSTRVQAQPRDYPAAAFLRYVNKWKED
ncbi:uncharacterized protein LOC131242836 [Magnolia sinica]|uniref:uncharacterized protein LOC131242836 n=1 Tax=Magnolia sinica TaxID=86752 RepID=UPI00265B38A5|nr:uncharacterized protein LOC131242836 [Magnolia sinica]